MDQEGKLYPPSSAQQPPPSQLQPPVYAMGYQPQGFPQQGFQPQPGFQGYPQPPPQYDGNLTAITQQPTTVIIHQGHLGTDAQAMTCPSCRASIVTEVKYEPAMKTHLIAGFMCIIGLYCCAFYPYCIESCQAAKHSCPNCGTYLGSSE